MKSGAKGKWVLAHFPFVVFHSALICKLNTGARAR